MIISMDISCYLSSIILSSDYLQNKIDIQLSG